MSELDNEDNYNGKDINDRLVTLSPLNSPDFSKNEEKDSLSVNFPSQNQKSFLDVPQDLKCPQRTNQNIEEVSTQKKTPFDLMPIEKSNSSFSEENKNSKSDSLISLSHLKNKIETQNKKIKTSLEIKILKQNFINKKRFNIINEEKEQENRIDYLLKRIKVISTQEMTKYGNYLISNCFGNKKCFRLSKPNSKEYTSIIKIDQNRNWLKLKIGEIFTIGKDSKSGSLQENNLKVIKRIKKLIDESEISEKIKKLKDFLEMSLEDFYVNIFYETNGFKKFCNEEKVIILDKEFKIQKGYSLREKNALIKHFNNS